jgi:hypothetical protein
MRRLVALSAVAALMLSLNSPLLAASCEHGKTMPACHRVREQNSQKPHCETMHHHDSAGETDAAEESTPASNHPVIQSAPSSQNCPMNCCQLGDRTNAVALAITPSLPQPAVVELTPSIVSVVFTSTGFSSHTDRGPPTA